MKGAAKLFSTHCSGIITVHGDVYTLANYLNSCTAQGNDLPVFISLIATFACEYILHNMPAVCTYHISSMQYDIDHTG